MTRTRSIDCRAQAHRLEIDVRADAMDLELPEVDLGADRSTGSRHALPAPAAHPASGAPLAPGGVLIYETFLVSQAERGRPTNPDFLLNLASWRRWSARWRSCERARARSTARWSRRWLRGEGLGPAAIGLSRAKASRHQWSEQIVDLVVSTRKDDTGS